MKTRVSGEPEAPTTWRSREADGHRAQVAEDQVQQEVAEEEAQKAQEAQEEEPQQEPG